MIVPEVIPEDNMKAVAGVKCVCLGVTWSQLGVVVNWLRHRARKQKAMSSSPVLGAKPTGRPCIVF